MAAPTTTVGADGDLTVGGWKQAAVRALHPSCGTVGADVLAAIAAGLASVTVPWELGHDEVPTERRYERVLSTPAYDAWVISWPSGGALDLHDHGGSAGALSVVAGQLDEATVDGNVTVGAHVVGGPDDDVRFHSRSRCCEPRKRRGDERSRVLTATQLDGVLRRRRRRCSRRRRRRCGWMGRPYEHRIALNRGLRARAGRSATRQPSRN